MIILTNKKTKVIFIIAVFEFILLVACIILLVIKPSNETNSSLPAYSVVDPTLTLNDGKFYYNGDTNSVYYNIQNGNMQFVFNEETYKEYLRENNYNENTFDKQYNWALDFWENPKPYNVWVWYLQPPKSDMLFLSFDTFSMEIEGKTVPIPGGGYTYIDENNFGSIGGSRGDTIFTRVSE